MASTVINTRADFPDAQPPALPEYVPEPPHAAGQVTYWDDAADAWALAQIPPLVMPEQQKVGE